MSALESGTRLGAYEILTLLGAGGFGEVYKARDLRLGRMVAVKILPSADSERRARFEREARAIAALQHPHICTLYDVGEQDGRDYLVLEYLEGETLANRLARGPLPLPEAVKIALQVADALEGAHRTGVVHRDLKPANIMLTPVGAKLLDFGVAVHLPAATATTALTVSSFEMGQGTVAGTIPYMSPEQLSGGPIDHRSDIFSFGAVLYEMIAGRRAFEGATSAPVVDAILSGRVARWPSGVPRALRQIVEKCLSRKPEDRYAQFADVRRGLSSIADTRRDRSSRATSSPAAGASALRAIAVLPFQNRTPDTSQDFLADGLTDMLIAELSRIGAVRVMSRATTARLARSGDVPAAARRHGVDVIVDGGLYDEAQGHIRIAVRLLDARSGGVLWTEFYDRASGNWFQLQRDVATAVAAELQLKLSTSGESRLVRPTTVDRGAVEHYLKGRFFLNRSTTEGIERSAVEFQQALECDSQYGPAHVGLAESAIRQVLAKVVSDTEGLARAERAATRALTCDALIPDAHVCLGTVALLRLDLAHAFSEYAIAISQNPNHADALARRSSCFMFVGSFDRSLADIEAAKQLDPMSPLMLVRAATAKLAAGRPDEALRERDAALALEPSTPMALYYAGLAHHALGSIDRACECLERAVSLTGHPSPASALAFVLQAAGRTRESAALLETLRARATLAEVSPFDFAEFFAATGDRERAMDYLRRSVELKQPQLLGIKCDPLFRSMRTLPAFDALVETLGLNQTLS